MSARRPHLSSHESDPQQQQSSRDDPTVRALLDNVQRLERSHAAQMEAIHMLTKTVEQLTLAKQQATPATSPAQPHAQTQQHGPTMPAPQQHESIANGSNRATPTEPLSFTPHSSVIKPSTPMLSTGVTVPATPLASSFDPSHAATATATADAAGAGVAAAAADSSESVPSRPLTPGEIGRLMTQHRAQLLEHFKTEIEQIEKEQQQQRQHHTSSSNGSRSKKKGSSHSHGSAVSSHKRPASPPSNRLMQPTQASNARAAAAAATAAAHAAAVLSPTPRPRTGQVDEPVLAVPVAANNHSPRRLPLSLAGSETASTNSASSSSRSTPRQSSRAAAAAPPAPTREQLVHADRLAAAAARSSSRPRSTSRSQSRSGRSSSKHRPSRSTSTSASAARSKSPTSVSRSTKSSSSSHKSRSHKSRSSSSSKKKKHSHSPSRSSRNNTAVIPTVTAFDSPPPVIQSAVRARQHPHQPHHHAPHHESSEGMEDPLSHEPSVSSRASQHRSHSKKKKKRHSHSHSHSSSASSSAGHSPSSSGHSSAHSSPALLPQPQPQPSKRPSAPAHVSSVSFTRPPLSLHAQPPPPLGVSSVSSAPVAAPFVLQNMSALSAAAAKGMTALPPQAKPKPSSSSSAGSSRAPSVAGSVAGSVALSDASDDDSVAGSRAQARRVAFDASMDRIGATTHSTHAAHTAAATHQTPASLARNNHATSKAKLTVPAAGEEERKEPSSASKDAVRPFDSAEPEPSSSSRSSRKRGSGSSSSSSSHGGHHTSASHSTHRSAATTAAPPVHESAFGGVEPAAAPAPAAAGSFSYSPSHSRRSSLSSSASLHSYPSTVKLSKKPCGVSGCTEHKLKGKHERWCLYHAKADLARQSNPNSRRQGAHTGETAADTHAATRGEGEDALTITDMDAPGVAQPPSAQLQHPEQQTALEFA